MKTIGKIAYCLLLSIFLTTSCSVQKRRYTDGFYTRWNNTHQEHPQKNQKQGTSATVSKKLIPNRLDENTDANYSASVNSKPEIVFEKKNAVNKNMFLKDTCDVILLKTGDEIKGKITEITRNVVKYKRCDNPEGPVIIIEKEDVFNIRYANGTKDVVVSDVVSEIPKKKEVIQPTYSATQAEKKTEGLGVAGLIVSVIGIFIGGIILGTLGVIFGAVSLNKIKKYPERFKNKKGFAIASIVVGIIAIIGAIIALMLVL